jgi:glutathione-specific gamma-glutamylcyclotransferase
MNDLWVFGYGSLIWKPGFPFAEQRRATLVGFHRALCIFSVRYRGTPAFPGLVFGLDAGGFCDGVAFRVASENVVATERYLRDREQVTGAYQAQRRLVELAHSGGEVRALCFIANRFHPQYAGGLPVAAQVRVVRASKGVSGLNADYVMSTADHLHDLGIRDRHVAHLASRLGRSAGAPPYPRTAVPRLPPDRALRCGYQRNLVL